MGIENAQDLATFRNKAVEEDQGILSSRDEGILCMDGET